MGLKDYQILDLTNVQSDALLIDQCNENSTSEFTYHDHAIRHMKFNERGLSRSRNRAIEHAQCDIGLICDDDEALVTNYPEIIVRAYENLPDADLICFKIENRPRNLKPKIQRINKLSAISIGSWQISLNIAAVRESGVHFDTLMGAGSGNGAGEETKFVRDCIAAGLKVYYVPENIGSVGIYHLETDKGGDSSWFTGINDSFFYQRGATTRYMLGLPVALAYALYYVPTHRTFIKQSMPPRKALTTILKGVFENPIGKQARELSPKRKQKHTGQRITR